MRYVWKIQTFDGKLHDSEKEAAHYLDVMYSNSMANVAAKLCQYSDGKHVKTMEWLNENLATFADLAKIKADMILIKDECEED